MIVTNLGLPIFVIALLANVALALVVLEYGPKDRSRIWFPLYVLAQMFWITINYFAFSVSAENFLFIARLTMFFATFHALFFFLFVRHFLSQNSYLAIKKVKALYLTGIVIAFLTFTPMIFSKLIVGADGNLAPKPGPLIPLFGIFVATCVGSAFYLMIKKFRAADGEEKQQWKFLMIGFILTFFLVLLFSFISFVVFGVLDSVRFGHLYTLPFVIFTAYAMIKHHLLNIRAVVAEIAAVLLSLIIFLQLVNSQSNTQFLISGFVLVGTVVLGILLIKSVQRETRQKERLQVLTVDLQSANNQLKALDLARAEFISIASHQLRTPPATVKWYLGAVLHGDYGKLGPSVKEILGKTERTNNLLISLIEDMLNVSRIERGKLEFLFAKTDVKDLAQITHEQLVPLAMEKKHTLTFSAPKIKLPEIMTDKEKLRQVMNNMIDNAIKYTPAGGKIEVSIKRVKDDIVFSVTDNGKGISPEDKEVIFSKYSRGKESIHQSAGLGLGMYVAQVIIEQHKGRIWAESDGPGKGSKFIFSIPINSGLKETTLFDLSMPAHPNDKPAPPHVP